MLDEHLLWWAAVSGGGLGWRSTDTGRGGLAAARVMTKAALLEQMVMSGSTAMIFLTRVTGGELVTA